MCKGDQMLGILKKHYKSILLVMIFSLITTGGLFAENKPAVLDSGNTSWLLISSALVLLMIPGLAFFYGGMVRSKNILNTLMMSFISMGVITIQWVIAGYSISFGDDIAKLIGWKTDYLLLHKIPFGEIKPDEKVPHLAFMVFQAMFAVITPALISGAVAERMKFSAYVVFIILWATLVYDPVCHWVWGGGWIQKMGALDYAGGTVVHINAGVSALAVALVLGKRHGYPKDLMLPNNLNFTLLGAGLLWFGWFGFNAGSALQANANATLAFVATFVATGAGAVGWALAEIWHRGKASALGVASGIVAGLVAITPAAGYVTPIWAIVIGLLAGFICYGGVLLKGKLGYDDSLDAFGVHAIGGIWGAIATGLFASVDGKGLITTGDPKLILFQIIAVLATAIYAFVVTFIIIKILDVIMGIRVTQEDEITGLDQTQHGETGYNI